MKRITTSIAAAVSLALLSLAVPTVASAQTTQTARTAQPQSRSASQYDYIGSCIDAIKSAERDAAIDQALDKDLHLPLAARLYDIWTTGSDVAQLRYELKHKLYYSAPFSASRIFYDLMGQIPKTGPFWSIGNPATSCLEGLVAWAIATDNAITPQIWRLVAKWLPWLLKGPAAPTGLTVKPDPQNGTVLNLTWHDNANNETSFEVNNGVESPRAPAHPGTGTVSYTWNGLKPGSRACFRVRATNVFGDSAWDPNAAPWLQCAYTSSPQPTPCTPKINAVGPFQATATQTVEITGSCFGSGNTTSGADTAYFRISDLTAGWNACWTGDPNTDQITCDISSWTNQKITFSGYTGNYGGSWVITKGDDIEVQVWNPQSGKGPATYEVVAG